jgi:hypothetical protein
MTDTPRPGVPERPLANSLEFLGLPGAGKTTIFKLILRELDRRSVAYRLIERDAAKILAPNRRGFLTNLFTGLAARELKRPPDSTSSAKYEAFAVFAREHAEFVRFIFETQETRITPTVGSELLLMGWALEQIWSYQAVLSDNRVGDALLVRDHSFSQLALSLLPYREQDRATLDSQLETYFSVTPAPKYLVLMRLSRHGIEERLEARGFPDRMRRLTPAARKAVLDRAAICVEVGVAQLRRRGVTVFEVDNDGPRLGLEGTARSIVGQIR